MAQLHAHWWTRPELPAASWLPDFTVRRRDADWYTSRRALFVEKYADRIGAWHLRLLESGECLEERSNARLADAPETLLHADLHLDNVLLRSNDRIPYVIDWARAVRGPGVLDLTQMVFGNTTLNHAEDIIKMYLKSLNAAGIDVEPNTLRYHLGGAVLRYFITWTCGVARWEPTSDRDRLMIDQSIAQAIRMIEYWGDQEPELLKL
jgi:aminoglycoside phosphotransferase (APT) family kinase protein